LLPGAVPLQRDLHLLRHQVNHDADLGQIRLNLLGYQGELRADIGEVRVLQVDREAVGVAGLGQQAAGHLQVARQRLGGIQGAGEAQGNHRRRDAGAHAHQQLEALIIQGVAHR